MAACLSLLSATSVPITISRNSDPSIRISNQRCKEPVDVKLYGNLSFCGRNSLSRRIRLNAGLSAIEPDLNEDPIDRWATPGVGEEDFKYGEWDGHHTYFEGEDEETFWESVAKDYAAVEPPTGFQGLISWMFLPAIAAGMYFNVPKEYLFIGAGVFTIVFTIIEMDKPDKPHNFEPHIYNMERGARDKLINDYNTMNIWDFNEKYGDLWDTTIKRDDIMKR